MIFDGFGSAFAHFVLKRQQMQKLIPPWKGMHASVRGLRCIAVFVFDIHI